jgi:ATP-binding cassette subfamily F protein uup
MTLLFSGQSLTKSFGTRILFKDLSVSIFSKDRIGLIGPNGSGKSTLLKIVSGIEKADEGTLSFKRGIKIGYVPQSCVFPDRLPKEILCDVLKDTELPDYEKELLAETWLSKMGFVHLDTPAAVLSGGWKKRLALARELIASPDLLLLDEPTNHLDLEGIFWLEKFLSSTSVPYLLVSHDRYFLQNAVNKIIEIDPVYPKGLFSVDGPYAQFLEIKEAFLEGQIEQERSLASEARRELEWLRASPKARTSKSKSRVEDAHELLDDLSDVRRRNVVKKASIDFEATQRETRKLIAVKNLCKQLGGRTLFKHLDFILSPGTRLGLMGSNGSGKTTLLRLLAGEILPDQGTLKRADGLGIVYFDQHRQQLPDQMTLRQALSPNGDFVNYRGQKIHVNGWCKRFLFSPDLLDIPLHRLSGGERARISIAHLMLQPADILLLDEPTNDLDIPTLETLEESLMDFPGAVVLITHDRCMLSRICTLLLAMGDPDQNTLFADYAQWEASLTPVVEKPKEKKEKSVPTTKAKLSYAEKREYEQMESSIAGVEAEIRRLNHLLGEVSQDTEKLRQLCTSIGVEEAKLEQLFLRWHELEEKQK